MKPEFFEFSSPSDPSFRVILNQDAQNPVILQTPPLNVVCELMEKVERDYISAFWHELMMERSRYDEGLPFALAAFRGGMTLIQPDAVVRELTRQSGRECNVWVREYLKGFSLAELQTALHAIMPRTIDDAIALLQNAGNQRLHAFSLIQCATQWPNFEDLVREFIEKVRAGKTTDSSFALFALVAMRSEGWIVFPTETNRQLGKLVGAATVRGRRWGDPSRLLSPDLKNLQNELEAVPAGDQLRTNDYSKVRYAIYGTNLRNINDLSWPLAAEILRKSASGGLIDPSAAIRDHWRKLCRAIVPSYGDNQTPVPSFLHNGPEPNNPLKRVLECPKDGLIGEHVLLAEFPSPTDPGYQVRVNLGSDSTIVEEPSYDTLIKVIREVEQVYVSEFWNHLLSPSPFVQQFPVALACTLQGHTQIRPAVVYEKLTGFNDLTLAETLQALRQYPFSELVSAISALRPNSVTHALALMTDAGKARFQGFSVSELVSKSTSFSSLVASLASTAMKSGALSSKRFAQQMLVAFCSLNWITLPAVVCNHIGDVLRGLHAKTSWIPDPMLQLKGGVSELYMALVGEAAASDERPSAIQIFYCRVAVLSTTMRGLGDLSVPLVNTLLACDHASRERKLVGPPSALRARWYRLCGANGPSLGNLSEGNDHVAELAKRCPEDTRLYG